MGEGLMVVARGILMVICPGGWQLFDGYVQMLDMENLVYL